MRGGAGSITFVGGGLLVAVAWLLGTVGLPPPYRPVTAVLAEPLAGLLVVLAWRFRRSRLALAALVIGLANLLVRGPLAEATGGSPEPALAALALLVPINLMVVALVPQRPLTRPGVAAHVAAILVQPFLVAGLLRLVDVVSPVGPPAGDRLGILGSHQTWLLTFLIAAVFCALIFAARRATFEVALLWVLVAAALAVLPGRGPHHATLMLGAAQLVLLFAVVEDSYRLAYHDELTGLPGRRALEESLRLLDGDYAVAMVDVDRFKHFNDRFGHDAGDQALRMVADELARVGGGGRAYRYGGEEFAILFPGRTVADTQDPLERLRVAVACRRFAIRAADRPRRRPEQPVPPATAPERVTVTVSIGVADSGTRAADPPVVLRAADAALYRAKSRGRNRLVVDGVRGRPKTRAKAAAK